MILKEFSFFYSSSPNFKSRSKETDVFSFIKSKQKIQGNVFILYMLQL